MVLYTYVLNLSYEYIIIDILIIVNRFIDEEVCLKKEVDNMPKKKNSIGELFDKKFDTLENKIDNLDVKVDKLETKVDDGFKTLFKMHFDMENKLDKHFEEMNEKQDKILSFVSNLVITTEGIKQDVAVINERVKQHEDKLELLS
jgi:hypothetical protein